MFAAVLPAKGDIAWVCPKFEEDRARELIRFGTDVRTWEEDEDPGRTGGADPPRPGDRDRERWASRSAPASSSST